jgi:hypothetical protein
MYTSDEAGLVVTREREGEVGGGMLGLIWQKEAAWISPASSVGAFENFFGAFHFGSAFLS